MLIDKHQEFFHLLDLKLQAILIIGRLEIRVLYSNIKLYQAMQLLLFFLLIFIDTLSASRVWNEYKISGCKRLS